jgi:hypothetical protein
VIERKDPAVTWGYSLPQSKHEALKAIAKHEARKKAKGDERFVALFHGAHRIRCACSRTI